MESFTSQIVKIGSHRIHVVTNGSGPLVLLIHGFPQIWYTWRHQLKALAEAGYRAAAIDLRGCGRSSKPKHPHDYRVTEYVADCVGVVEKLGESTAVIVGHDIGSFIAWTAAWTRPDIFRAVVGTTPFGGRGMMCLPGSPLGERKPSEIEREIAGEDLLFYREFFSLEGIAEAAFEHDIRDWLYATLYNYSASPPPLREFEGLDLGNLTRQQCVSFIRQVVGVRHGSGLRERMATPTELPDWLTDADIDFYTAEFERTGFTGALSYYRCHDLDWELLAPYAGKPVQVPALFLTGERDVSRVWGRESIEKFPEAVPHLRGQVILKDCGHWVQEEKPEETNAALIGFLKGL